MGSFPGAPRSGHFTLNFTFHGGFVLKRIFVRWIRQRVDDEDGDVVAVVFLFLRSFAQRRGGGGGRQTTGTLCCLFNSHRVPQPIRRYGYTEPGLLVRDDHSAYLRFGDDAAFFPVAVADGAAHGEAPGQTRSGPTG